MIEHLRGREQALEPFGWTGREAEWVALVCLHSGVFTRAQFRDYFDAHQWTAARFVQALVERREAVESDTLIFNGGPSRAGYQASRSTGRSGSRTSDIGGKPSPMLSSAVCSLSITSWNIRDWAGCPPSRRGRVFSRARPGSAASSAPDLLWGRGKPETLLSP